MSAGYATSLMKALRESYTNSPAALREVSASLSPSPHPSNRFLRRPSAST